MTTLKDLNNTAQAIRTQTQELKEQYHRIYGHLRYEHVHIGGEGEIEIPEFHFQPVELSKMIFDVMMELGSVECDCGRDVSRILENCISERDIRRAILEWLKEH